MRRIMPNKWPRTWQRSTTSMARAQIFFLPRQPADLAALIGRRPPQVNAAFEEGRIRDILERGWPDLKHNPPGLLHGDFWPGNILWQGEHLAAVIDWEDACIGEPLSDLAIGRLDLLWIIGRDAMQTFTRRYLSDIALDITSLPYWDLYAALRLARLAGGDLAWWAASFHPYGQARHHPTILSGTHPRSINQAFETIATT